MTTVQKEQAKTFIATLRDKGELYFNQDTTEEDYQYITGVLNRQGYYAGEERRYYFDNALKLVRSEPRYNRDTL